MRRLRSWIGSEWRRIAGLRAREVRDGRADEEFRFHLEMLIARNERSGMSREEARRAAHVQFGGVDRYMEDARDEHRSRPLEDLGRDMRRAVRNLVRVPAFTTAAVLTLGLGIGATTVMYSIVDHVVLRPLPYPDADRLALVRVEAQELRDQVSSLAVNSVRFLEWRERCALCEDVGAVAGTALTWRGAGDPLRLDGLRVSSNLLPLLGARAQHGRLFRGDEESDGASNVVVLSDAFWKREFGGDPAAIGRTIVLNDAPRVIVGVLPAGFRLPKRDELGAGTELPAEPQVYVPLTFAEWELRGQGGFDYVIITRLSPGVTTAQAQAHLDELESAITARYGAGLTIRSLVMPLHEHVVGGSRRGLVLLLGAVGAVLLLVCVNLASLLLARNAGRAREAAVRVALGAGRGRLIRESLTESLVLALAAGLLGLLLAQVGLAALLQLAPSDLPRLHDVRFDARIAAAGVMLSLLTGVLFGILPALRTGGADPGDAMKAGGRTQSQSRATSRARTSLIAAQVALTAVLLVTAGLFLSSFARVLDVDRGFRAEQALALDVVVPRSAYADGGSLARVYDELLERMARIPGVAGAAATSRLPLDGVSWADAMSAESDARPAEEFPVGYFHFVTPGYFTTLDVPVRGTAFTRLDDGRSVVVLSAHAASLIFPDGEDPIGRRVQLGDRVAAEVIGVAADVAATGIAAEPGPIVYLPPWTALGFPSAASVVLRTDVDPQTLATAARSAVRDAGAAGIAIARVRTLEQMVDEATAARRFQLSLLLLFALTALVTACVGIYGVVAHSLAGRRSEIGVRMALGAHRSDIHRLVVRQGIAAAAIGLIGGFAVAVALGRVVQSLLFGVRAADPVVLIAVATLLALVTATATWIPARRATARDLALTLRD
jgi:predicted permease